MTPAARAQAAIELLDTVIIAARDNGPAADTLIQRYFAARRYAGSKDRRAVRELVYAVIRACGERPAGGRAAMLLLAGQDADLAATFDGSPHGPAPIAADEPRAAAGVAPAWLTERLAASGLDAAEQGALAGRAPLDIRVNRLKGTPTQITEQIAAAEPIAGLPDALRLPAGTDLAPFAGLVEPQDAGSQVVTLAAAPQPGQQIVDLCAGAGGKTLALAAAMGEQGHILACDTDRGRLSRLSPRAAQAGVTIAETRLLNPGRELELLADWQGRADTVLIDAPCSGTGTWRRNPEARWRLTPGRIDRLVAMQARLLDLGAALVRPGGALVYVVCSLLDEEGADQAGAFASRQTGWTPAALSLPAGSPRGPGLRLTPASDGTDGFFVARFTAP
ncbi:RsmB/NOP family class I SAM-dependent RNA methyltransferase [uncultured Sphingomonas sp.]|uniref:RsmB/NOP family class I SAM-dependent RNA methyltransferase n=1 Tax=uncultured Sphingomonas sp. TaxID=158754 RepID=UPI0035CB3B57